MLKKSLLLSSIFLLAGPLAQAEKISYVPKVGGTLRARYEYLTNQDKGGFKVRNLRVDVDGNVAPILSYRGEVDFADWGKVNIIDAFIRVKPLTSLNFAIGQQRMPFSIASHRRPYQQYFVSRTFIAKTGGTIRDIGLTGAYTVPKIPLTVQAGVFNCSGTGESQSFFTKTYGFSAKLISPFCRNWYVSASVARLTKGVARVQLWDIGGYFDNGLWHVEAEYLRKNYVHGAFKPVNMTDFFVYRNFPIGKKMIDGVSAAVRYDYTGDHSSGIRNDEGKLIADDPARHRITLGATLSLEAKMQADFRINYEKNFFRSGAVPTTANDDRIVLEVIARF